jgi:hypothetical protein
VLPTGAQLAADYLQPLADLPAVKPHLRYGARVAAVTRLGVDRVRTAGREAAPFLVRLATGEDLQARAVLDASGTWGTPNVLGGSGIPAHGETAAVIEPALPDVLGRDRDRFAGWRTLVVGAGHSAATTLLALADLARQAPGTSVVWAIRSASPARTYGGEAADALSARGAIGARLRAHVAAGTIELFTGFAVHTLRSTPDGRVEVSDGARTVVADRIVAATGFRPDHAITAELRLDLDPILGSTRALAPALRTPGSSRQRRRPGLSATEIAYPFPNRDGNSQPVQASCQLRTCVAAFGQSGASSRSTFTTCSIREFAVEFVQDRALPLRLGQLAGCHQSSQPAH